MSNRKTNQLSCWQPLAANTRWLVAINRCAQRHSKHKTKNINDPQKKCRLGTVSKIFFYRLAITFAGDINSTKLPCLTSIGQDSNLDTIRAFS